MISVEELPEPRPHHYVFAHQWLPRFAQSNSAAFFALFTTGEGQAAMVNFWDTVGESLAPELRLPSDGLTVHWIQLHPGLRALIVQMPAPTSMTEAHFVAAVAVPPSDDEEADVPVFSLQYAWDFEKAQPQTAVATWDGGGIL